MHEGDGNVEGAGKGESGAVATAVGGGESLGPLPTGRSLAKLAGITAGGAAARRD